MPSHFAVGRISRLGEPNSFAGFALPTSSTTYTPNQFFDVCLPYASRGCVRAVGFLIRKTLGWCDEHGNPTEAQFRLSYVQFERGAGIGHSSIKAALDEAVGRNFVIRKGESRASVAGRSAESSTFELRWDARPHYAKHPELFSGFFEGEANRTDIPNQYFDVVVRTEPLSVIQVVGAIIRFSIGFQAKRGARRQQAVLSYADLRRYTKIRSPRVLAAALRRAEARHYIVRVDRGFFDPDAGRLSRAATYMLRWADHPTTPKSEPTHLSGKGSGTAPKREAADHPEKVSGIQMKPINDTSKQQPAAPVLLNKEGFEQLRTIGFDVRAAADLSDRYAASRIRRQVEWLGSRRASRNPLGLLRRAIEEDWSPPAKGAVGFTQLPSDDRVADRDRRELLRQQAQQLTNRFKL